MLITQGRQKIPLKYICLIGERLLQTILDTLRRDLKGWIHSEPALLRLPILNPSMGIKLTHLHKLSRRIGFATLITGHHARRNTCRTQCKHHRSRIVRTKTTATAKQKLIHTVIPQQGWFKSVVIGFLIKMAQHSLH